MSVLSKKEVLNEFYNAKENDLFCVYCYERLTLNDEGVLYCPNEMCLSEQEYNDKGQEVDE